MVGIYLGYSIYTILYIWNPDHLAKTCTYMVYTCQRHPCPMLGDRHVADMFVNFTICVDMYIPNPKITNMS